MGPPRACPRCGALVVDLWLRCGIPIPVEAVSTEPGDSEYQQNPGHVAHRCPDSKVKPFRQNF